MIAVLIIAPGVDPEAQVPDDVIPFLIIGMVLLFISVAGVWFFIIYDTIHVAKNKASSSGAKAGWICAIYFLNIFIIPVYWLKHINK